MTPTNLQREKKEEVSTCRWCGYGLTEAEVNSYSGLCYQCFLDQDSPDQETLERYMSKVVSTPKPLVKREKIKIVCAKDGCPRSKMVDREDTDPIKAVTMKILCPWHEDSEFETPTYYDKDGNELSNDPEEAV